MNKSDLVAVRGYHPDDRNFILASWLKGLKYGNELFQAIDTDIYYATYQKVLINLLNSPGIQVNIVCLKDQPDVILGYSVYRQARLDWVFVKKAWRNIGLSKILIPTNITTVSHLTKAGSNLLRKYPQVKFNPFVLG